MADRALIYRLHAIERMFERNIRPGDVGRVLMEGEVIERYEDDIPYPSRLVLGTAGNRPVHVVAADIPGENTTIVISVYEPDSGAWEDGFRRRKKR